MREIELTKDKIALVDDEDYDDQAVRRLYTDYAKTNFPQQIGGSL